MKTIKFTISKTGDITLETTGFTGKQCEITKKLEAELGTVTQDRKTGEYYACELPAQQKIGGGQ
jgi:hypothetical protein